MTERDIAVSAESTPVSSRPPRRLRRRVLRMMLLWMLFGMFIGVTGEAGASGFIGALAGLIAGALVMPWLGLCAGLLGAEVKPTLIGATAGALVGTLSGALWSEACPWSVGHVVLIGGALAGATVPVLTGQVKRQVELIGRVFGSLLAKTAFVRVNDRLPT
jgi:hypothetical protein